VFELDRKVKCGLVGLQINTAWLVGVRLNMWN
jgi:hypothetical protein